MLDGSRSDRPIAIGDSSPEHGFCRLIRKTLSEFIASPRVARCGPGHQAHATLAGPPAPDRVTHDACRDKLKAMSYEDLLTLIPSHSLEDFPTELGEAEAASLLNAFAVPWHPHLLASARTLPRWHRADDPPDASVRRLIFVPSHCEGWLPADWATRAESGGCVLVRHLSDRKEMLARALAPLGDLPPVDPDLAADFLALGFCHLQIELLTRKMRNYGNLDEALLRREAVAAAEAALAQDHDAARARLKECFEVLREARDRFYPVDCWLVDVCLVTPAMAGSELQRVLDRPLPINLLISAQDLDQIATGHPETLTRMAEGVREGWIALVGGDLGEQPLSLWPVNSILWQLREAQSIAQRHLGQPARVWGRRRFGLFPLWPQVLKKAGFAGALHLALDDGFYPDQEHTKFRWEGVDRSSIDSISRIPLAADAATSYLRFPTRMAESMDHDHTAGILFARWPQVESPFLEDLRRMHGYAHVLGRFVTLTHFFDQTDSATTAASPAPREYLTPFLFQAVAREEANSLSRVSARIARRDALDRALTLRNLGALLAGRTAVVDRGAELERSLELLAEEVPLADAATQATALEAFAQESGEALSRLVLHGAGDRPGWLVFNTLGFARTAVVELPPHASPPAPLPEQGRVQWAPEKGQRQLVVNLPPCGFAWVAADTPNSSPAGESKSLPLASPTLLQNEFFEVHLNSQTGGIAKIKEYGRKPNRLSQQLNYRFARERTFNQPPGPGLPPEQVKSYYAEARHRSTEVISTGPTLGQVQTSGEIVDQQTGQRLAEFRQTISVWRGRPVIDLIFELTIDRMPDGEGWHNYFTSRFAWNDETAALSCLYQGGVHAAADERLESPWLIEIATPEHRTTLLPRGLPFHRKSGPRMVDSILVVAHETQRRFHYSIALDQNYPMQAALDVQTPPLLLPTQAGPPRAGLAGWFCLVEPANVQLQQLTPLRGESPATPGSAVPVVGCRMRLLETEGRPVRAQLRCVRNPVEARQVDLTGGTLAPLTLQGDSVLIDLTAYEIADVEVLFTSRS